MTFPVSGAPDPDAPTSTSTVSCSQPRSSTTFPAALTTSPSNRSETSSPIRDADSIALHTASSTSNAASVRA